MMHIANSSKLTHADCMSLFKSSIKRKLNYSGKWLCATSMHAFILYMELDTIFRRVVGTWCSLDESGRRRYNDWKINYFCVEVWAMMKNQLQIEC